MHVRLIPLASLALAACTAATPPPGNTGCYQGPCIAIGEAQKFGIMRVTPLSVLSDSRCPIEAECAWAGELRVSTRLDIGHETITVELKAYEPFTINGGTLLLAEVAPDASSQWPNLSDKDYAFRFSFTTGE